jgi:hypothetical protein
MGVVQPPPDRLNYPLWLNQPLLNIYIQGWPNHPIGHRGGLATPDWAEPPPWPKGWPAIPTHLSQAPTLENELTQPSSTPKASIQTHITPTHLYHNTKLTM